MISYLQYNMILPRLNKQIILILFFTLLNLTTYSQTTTPTLGYRNYTTVNLNFSKGGAIDNVPFDVPFILAGKISQSVRKITLTFGDRDDFYKTSGNDSEMQLYT